MVRELLNPRIIELEGMAMAGKVVKAYLEDCPPNEKVPSGWKRIVATLEDGTKYVTGCMEGDAAKRNYMVITLYARKWGKLISWSEKQEE